MKERHRFIKTLIIGGLFLVLPLVVIIILFEKLLGIFRMVVQPIVNLMPTHILHEEILLRITGGLLILLLCFFAGLFYRTRVAKSALSWLEKKVLYLIPGYALYKSMTESYTGHKSSDAKQAVIVNMGEAYQIGFLMDDINDLFVSVFIPAAPSAMSGDVFVVKKKHVKLLNVSDVEAVKFATKMGVNAKNILKGSIDSDPFPNDPFLGDTFN